MDDQEPAKLFHFVTIRDPLAKKRGVLDMRVSQARSHAARITHMRKRKKNRKTTEDERVSYWKTGVPRPLFVDNDPDVSKPEYSPSPLSLLGQHKVDPFESYPIGPLPPYLRNCLEYGKPYAQLSGHTKGNTD